MGPELEPTIQLGHGGGGRLSQQLLHGLLLPGLGVSANGLHDAALLPLGGQPGQPSLAYTTDSYVVRPLCFPGGDIGRLAVIGTVNDLAMAGASPLALGLGLILEEGLPIATLQTVVNSIQEAAAACGVAVVTGDTKVVERGKGDGLYINTSGVGVVNERLVREGRPIHPGAIGGGDAVLVSGDLGRHGIAILAAREQLGLRTTLLSDLASLLEPVQALLELGFTPHCLRDLTRGGLASAVDEIARSAQRCIDLEEGAIPVDIAVQGACDLLGLDPVAMANEGRMVVILPSDQAEAALAVLQRFQPQAARIGTVGEAFTAGQRLHPVRLGSSLGAWRPLDLGQGELLPRIC